ncbi:hypothetical protein HNR46_000114 [Haloferula luteola]|uniref:Uncharacterized protein n=1 Tax=Haloferula luteola TaxID=595692 RepID=A0A840UY49_9BACT|nr:hypothetical protein [Haloferula luteola]
MRFEEVAVKSPFDMPALKVPVFPEWDFAISGAGVLNAGWSC